MDIDQALLEKLTSQIKTQDDLADLSRQLLKHAVEHVMVTSLKSILVTPKTTATAITPGKNRGQIFHFYTSIVV